MIETESISEQITHICERTKYELLAVVQSLSILRTADTRMGTPEWMTAAQLAEYWQLVDEDRKPRTAGILKWTKRRPDEFPLPHAYMGDLLRFHREDVDQWAKEESERRRIQNEGKRLKIA